MFDLGGAQDDVGPRNARVERRLEQHPVGVLAKGATSLRNDYRAVAQSQLVPGDGLARLHGVVEARHIEQLDVVGQVGKWSGELDADHHGRQADSVFATVLLSLFLFLLRRFPLFLFLVVSAVIGNDHALEMVLHLGERYLGDLIAAAVHGTKEGRLHAGRDQREPFLRRNGQQASHEFLEATLAQDGGHVAVAMAALDDRPGEVH